MRIFGRFGLLGSTWIIIGIVVAWQKGYIDGHFIRDLISVILAVFLWFLPLLGISLHVH